VSVLAQSPPSPTQVGFSYEGPLIAMASDLLKLSSLISDHLAVTSAVTFGWVERNRRICAFLSDHLVRLLKKSVSKMDGQVQILSCTRYRVSNHREDDQHV
jgi:hypothetical protein